jgi:hypothetical protein
MELPDSPGEKEVDFTASGYLKEATLQLHWAIQPVSSVGTTLAVPESDFGHTTLVWDSEKRSLVGRKIEENNGFRVGLNLESFVLWFLDEDSRTCSDFELKGKTLVEARAWVAEKVREQTKNESEVILKNAAYDLPAHPVADGAPFFVPDGQVLSSIADWYDLSARLLEHIRGNEPRASAVRCWPHHFDIATLISLDSASEDPENARSIGVGMSPGDGSYGEPYFYVTPWPYPDEFNPPPLPHGGHWHREGWTGAVLTASALSAAGNRESAAAEFLEVARKSLR